MKYWRVTFLPSGQINQIREVKAPNHNRWVVVRAEDEETARKKAFSIYSARKKKEAKERHHAAGNCACGRKQDRLFEDGRLKKECSVCATRQAPRKAAWFQRQQTGAPPAVRNEVARVEACQARVRDRKSEMRLEVLVEVKNKWCELPTIGAFGKWLETEVQKCLTTPVASSSTSES